MTDLIKEHTPIINVQDEIDILKARADLMGIKYSPNIGLETLRERINEKTENVDSEEKNEIEEEVSEENQKIYKARQAALRLRRVNITPMDNTKTELNGEIFTVSNSVVGTIKRMIPFGVDWHIEQIILDTLLDKQFQRFTSNNKSKDAGGYTRKTGLVPAYNIQLLPALTDKELTKLAKNQSARNSVTQE